MERGRNLARLTIHYQVPVANLELLVQHNGAYDALDPSSPYEARRQIEAALHKERTLSVEYRDRGRKLCAMLGELSVQCMVVPEAVRSVTADAAGMNEIMIDIGSHKAVIAKRLTPLPNAWMCTLQDGSRGLFAAVTLTALRGIVFKAHDLSTDPYWADVQVTPNADSGATTTRITHTRSQ